MGKDHRERRILVIKIRFSSVLGFLYPYPLHVGRDSLFIQVVSVLIGLHSSALFEHLTA